MSENVPSKIDYNDQKMIATIKGTVAKDATPEEFVMFMELCKASGLNPFKREVWFIKAGGRAQIMTGIGGFMAIANSHPMYDGMVVEVDDDENPTKATCSVYRKDRKFPSVGVALMKEYRKSGPTWQQMPRVMLTKVAKSIAIREAFPQELNGLYTAEEMPEEYSGRTENVNVVKAAPKEYRYTMAATKKFVPPGDEDRIKARLKKDFGATFDKESGELVTKKLVPGWDEALTVNVKAKLAADEAMGDDDLPFNEETGEIEPEYVDEEAEAHFAGLAVNPPDPKVLNRDDAKAVVERMKKTKTTSKSKPYVDAPIEFKENI